MYHVAKVEWGSPGNKHICMRAFLGIISAQKVSLGELLIYTNPRLAAEEGTNVHLGEVAERCENTSPGTVLKAECTTGTTMNGFMQVKKCAAEPATAAEGDMWVVETTTEQMHMLLGAWRCWAPPPSQ